jgi:RNA polymerase sigma factor (sigma-70 family)
MSSRTEQDKHLPDSLILQTLRSGAAPDEAIRQLYRMQFSMAKAYIKQNSGTDEDAEDIFQEVIISFIELVKKDKFRGESSISTFLYAITRNTWLNELKKRGRTRLRNEKFEKAKENTGMDISFLMVNRELKAQLMQVVDSLGATCKTILLAFYFENLAIKDILQTLDYENEQVVRNKKYKCLKQLEQLITSETQLAQNLKAILSYE